jgi:hypothetical protein
VDFRDFSRDAEIAKQMISMTSIFFPLFAAFAVQKALNRKDRRGR